MRDWQALAERIRRRARRRRRRAVSRPAGHDRARRGPARRADSRHRAAGRAAGLRDRHAHDCRPRSTICSRASGTSCSARVSPTRSTRASATRSPCSCPSPARRARARSPASICSRASRRFTVSGIFEVGAQEHDNVLAFVSLQDAAAIAGTRRRAGRAAAEIRGHLRRSGARAARLRRRWAAVCRPATGRSRTPATSAPSASRRP